IYALARSENSRYLASAAWDQQVFLWDSRTNQLFARATVRPQVFAMAFSPTGRWIAAAGTKGQVDFIRVRDQRIVNKRHISSGKTIFALAYLPNKSEDLIVGDASGGLRLWSVMSGHERYVPNAHSSKILSVTVSPDGKLVASGGTDRSVTLWTNTLTKLSRIERAHLRYVTALRFTPDGHYLASAGADSLVRLWDVKSLKPIGSPFVGH